METYGQNLRFNINSLGYDETDIDIVSNLPIDGYTIEFLNANFQLVELNLLLVNLNNALDSTKFLISRTQQDINVSTGRDAESKRALLAFLDQIRKDLEISINNIKIVSTPKKDEDPILPTTAPKILVKGITFPEIEIGDSTTLPITIENTGDDILVINGYFGFDIGADYSVIAPDTSGPNAWPEITPDVPLKLGIGETKKLDIRFAPTIAREYTVDVKFTSNATEGTNTAIIKGKGKPIVNQGVDSILGKKQPNTKRILTIKNVRELTFKSKNNPDVNSPYFDQQLTTHKAQIVADIYQAFVPFGQTNQIERKVLENVVIARGIGSFWFEKCDDFLGGLRPSYQYYYDMEEVKDVLSWKTLIKEDYNIVTNSNGFLNQSGNGLGISGTDINTLFQFRSYIEKIKEELDSNDSYWGKFDSNAPNKTLRQPGTVADDIYLSSVIKNVFKSKTNIKIYGGFRENFQTRALSLPNNNFPDLNTSVEGNNIGKIDYGFISNNAYGRLNCLQPKTGCFITAERPLNDVRSYGDEIIKLLTKSSLPEKIPDHPCYRGYKAEYIRSFNWERRWEVILDCLGVIYTEYEWRSDENLFNDKGTIFSVWEDVEFSGTEIGFSENCIPVEKPRVQEPYVDMSDNLGCYELQTTKIYMKYADYNSPGDRDYIKGPEILSIQDYSGLGPGIKLNRKVKRADCDQSPVRIFHPLKMGSDIITGRDNLITKGLFNGTQSPSSHHTSSIQNEQSKKYIYTIVDNTVLKNNKPISYYSVAYGNKNGSGSVYSGYETNDSTTKAIYSQNRLLALETSETEFTTYTSGSLTTGRKDIYVINFNRDSLTDRLDPGNFEISLCELTSNPSKIMTFIDNSNDILEDKFSNDYVYSSFDIVSGSLENGIHDSGTGSLDVNNSATTYGKIYPALGIVVFDAEKLDNNLSYSTDLSTNIDTNNSLKIFNSITGAADLGFNMKARGSSNKKSNHYFVRVSAGICNYSNNPTMVNETLTNNNIIKHEFFKHNPITYITTVGLYNDAEELLAVAKLSKPVKKTPETDILIKIRLNW